MIKPTIRDRIKEIVFRYFMPKIEAKAKNPSDKVYEQFATALIQEELKSTEIETFIDELLALLSPQTGEGECDCCKCYCEKCTKECWHSPCKVHPPLSEEMDWEKAFENTFESLQDTHETHQYPEVDCGHHNVHEKVKAFLRTQLDLQKEKYEILTNTLMDEITELRSKLSSKK